MRKQKDEEQVMLERVVKKARIGLYTAGLKAYWSQFEEMRERMLFYGHFIEERLGQWCDVYNFGLVDDPESGIKAGEWFNRQNVDLVFLHCGTYFTSASILPVHQICKAPVVLLNLQPTAQMDYDHTSTGEWLCNCGACPAPETANALNRSGIPFRIVNGLLGMENGYPGCVADEVTAALPEAAAAWKEIRAWVDSATVKRNLMGARFGYLGSAYSGMLDMYSDFTMIQAQTGIITQIIEMCDLASCLEQVTDREVHTQLKDIANFFEIAGDSPSDPISKRPTTAQMEWAAKVAAAQERLVKEFGLDSITYYYHAAPDNAYEKLQGGFIVGHSLLTAAGISCAGEGDLKTAIAMKISDLLGVGGSYAEIVAVDYVEKSILLGHDGPFHVSIADQKPLLRGMSLFHGKTGSGVSVEAKVKTGPVSMLGVTQTGDGKLKFIAGEGESIRSKILLIGNTETHVVFDRHPDVYMADWFQHAPTHHLALSIGRNGCKFEKTADLMNIPFAKI